MSTFSIRNNLHVKMFQKKSINQDLRTNLWNCIYRKFQEELINNPVQGGWHWTDGMYDLVESCWTDFFYRPVDTFPQKVERYISEFRKIFFDLEWNKVYDLLEFFSNSLPESFTKDCNFLLERENSAYRFVNKIIVEIINDEHISSIAEAAHSPYYIVNEHLLKSLKLLSSKENADFKNSLKESISAVEALARILADNPKGTLGDLMNNPKINLHPSLKEGIKKIYGFTSDQSGIRHANKEDDMEIGHCDAMFGVIFCSAFINYAISKNSVASGQA